MAHRLAAPFNAHLREFHIAGERGSLLVAEPSEDSLRQLIAAYPARGKLHEYLLSRYGHIPSWAAGYFTKQRADAVARTRPTRAEEKRRKRTGSVAASRCKPTPSLRERVYQRDLYRCVICQSPEDLTIDHWIPRARGGRNTFTNCRTMCRSCNHAKGDKMPAEFLTMDGAPGKREHRMALLRGDT